jgi:hypothetical protein
VTRCPLQSQVNLIISLKRMLEESEIIMKFTNFLSNDTGQSTKHFDLKSSGFDNLQQLERFSQANVEPSTCQRQGRCGGFGV